ncbi:MAG: DUF6717 family protein [Prevotella sp.]|nr:DUF6717 family protein [Prevotella sp.]
MSNLKTYFKKGVSVYKKGLAYVRAVSVLFKATYHRLVGNGIYDVSFIKIREKWYCEVPGFPNELFEHTLMVAGAARFLDYQAKGARSISMKIRISDKGTDNNQLVKNSSTLTGGAFYSDLSGSTTEEIWLCPVTLFLLGRYPKIIHILDVRHCIPSDKLLEDILYSAIEHCQKDIRKHFEETVVAEFRRAKSFTIKATIVDDFAESVGYDYRKG